MEPKDWSFQYQTQLWRFVEVSQYQSHQNIVHQDNSLDTLYQLLNGYFDK